MEPMTSPRHPNSQWLPVRLGPADTTLLSIILCCIALIRGLDYLTGPDVWGAKEGEPTPPVLIGVEGAFPLWLWGIALIIGAAVLISGMVRRHHFSVFLGHCALGVIYTGLFFGLLVGYLEQDYFDGIRGAVGLISPSVYCLIVAVRMGSRPVQLWRA